MSNRTAPTKGGGIRLLISALVGSLLSVTIHGLLGWEWTAIAGIAVGYFVVRHGWLAGSVAVALGWGWIVVYSFIVAPGATIRLSQTFAGLIGNLPGFATVALTLLIAAMIGALGGALGSLLAVLRTSQAQRRHYHMTV
jgi:hypothetical protein